MRKLSKEAQMQKNGGKKLRITCNGHLENRKATGCPVHKVNENAIKQVAELQMGIHQSSWGCCLCTYTWVK